MGKAADNERAKLNATFYNNLSVGAAITGALLPFLNLAQLGYDLGVKVGSESLLPWQAVNWPRTIIALLGLCAAIFATYMLRQTALEEIAKIQD